VKILTIKTNGRGLLFFAGGGPIRLVFVIVKAKGSNERGRQIGGGVFCTVETRHNRKRAQWTGGGCKKIRSNYTRSVGSLSFYLSVNEGGLNFKKVSLRSRQEEQGAKKPK